MAALKTAWNWRGRLAKGELGAELIEFALVLPLLLLLVLGIVDFGFLFQRLEVITNAAREGARVAVLPGYTSADVTARVTNYLTQGGVPVGVGNPVINVNSVTVTAGTKNVVSREVVVTYSHSYMFLSGLARWFGGSFSTVPLRGASTMRLEGGS
jgi:Flp pilus assembly protein TadG